MQLLALHFFSLLIEPVRSAADQFGFNRFYYSSYNQNGYFATQPVKLVVTTASTSVTWTEATGACLFYNSATSSSTTFTTTSSATTNVTCPLSTQIKFTVFRNADSTSTDTFYITFLPSNLQWYAVMTSAGVQSLPMVANTTFMEARFWIVDPLTQGNDESLAVAVLPSSSSAQLSRSYQTLGEYPTPSFDLAYFSFATTLSFDSTKSIWKVSFNSTAFTGGSSISAFGRKISILGKIVADSSFAVQVQKYSLIGLTSTTVSATAGSSFKVFADACSNGVLFATSSFYGTSVFAFTQAGFSSLDPNLSSVYQMPISGSVLKIVSVLQRALLLTASGVYYCSSNWICAQSTGIPSTQVLSGIQGPQYCDPRINKTSFTNYVVAAWDMNAINTVVPVYISIDGGITFTSISVNTDITSSGTGGRVYHVAIQHASATLCVLIKDGSGFVDRTLLVDLTNTSNTTLGFTSSPSLLNAGVKGAAPQLQAFSGGELLIYGDGLNYSPDGGRSIYPILMPSRDPSRPAVGLSAAEYIIDIVGTSGGKYAVLTSTQRIFIGVMGLSSTLEVEGGIDSASSVRLGFDELSGLYVYSPISVSPFVLKRYLPVSNELASLRAPLASNLVLVCPLFTWKADSFSNYTLDIGDAVNLNSYMVSSIQSIIAYSNTSVFASTNARTYPIENLDIVSQESVALSITPTCKGRSDLLLRPSTGNLACAKLQQSIQMIADCPPSRTIIRYIPASITSAASPTPRYHINRYTTDTASTVSLAVATPTISTTSCSGSLFSGLGSQNTDLYCSIYGSPQKVYYGSSFRPSFAIFQNGAFVKTVQADMGIMEMNGKNTYQFNMTAANAGCRINPTSIKSGGFPSSYTKCYDPSNSISISSDEIINGTNGNAISWNGGANGIYLFQARVLDSTYSYCNLTTSFAVEVVGAPSNIGWQLMVVFGCDLIGIVILGISYLSYSMSRRAQVIKEGKQKLD